MIPRLCPFGATDEDKNRTFVRKKAIRVAIRRHECWWGKKFWKPRGPSGAKLLTVVMPRKSEHEERGPPSPTRGAMHTRSSSATSTRPGCGATTLAPPPGEKSTGLLARFAGLHTRGSDTARESRTASPWSDQTRCGEETATHHRLFQVGLVAAKDGRDGDPRHVGGRGGRQKGHVVLRDARSTRRMRCSAALPPSRLDHPPPYPRGQETSSNT